MNKISTEKLVRRLIFNIQMKNQLKMTQLTFEPIL